MATNTCPCGKPLTYYHEGEYDGWHCRRCHLDVADGDPCPCQEEQAHRDADRAENEWAVTQPPLSEAELDRMAAMAERAYERSLEAR